MGGFAHSDGLEALAACGAAREPRQLEALLAAHLRLTLRRSDAHFVRASHRLLQAGDLPALSRSAGEDLASRASALQRRSALVLGRNLLRVARAIARPAEEATLDAIELCLGQATPRASVFGCVANVLGICEEDAVEGHVYVVLAGMIAAAVRLGLLPPLESQAALRRLLARRAADPVVEWGLFSPLLDIATMRHELADGRAFAS